MEGLHRGAVASWRLFPAVALALLAGGGGGCATSEEAVAHERVAHELALDVLRARDAIRKLAPEFVAEADGLEARRKQPVEPEAVARHEARLEDLHAALDALNEAGEAYLFAREYHARYAAVELAKDDRQRLEATLVALVDAARATEGLVDAFFALDPADADGAAKFEKEIACERASMKAYRTAVAIWARLGGTATAAGLE